MDEVSPPWIALPGLDPWEPATHGLAEVYFDLNWLPFWRTLTPEQKAEYLHRWNASPQWREAIATLYEHEGIDLVEEGRLEAEWREKRQAREAKRPWWRFW